MRRLAVLFFLLLAPGAQAQRVFPEPINARGPIQHGDHDGPSQLADGFRELERRHPGFLDFTTIDRELGDPNAVSLGPDGRPAWDPADSKDGLPFYVAAVTDESVPDRDKAYVLAGACARGRSSPDLRPGRTGAAACALVEAVDPARRRSARARARTAPRRRRARGPIRSSARSSRKRGSPSSPHGSAGCALSSLLMERDQYWPCNPDCDESPTLNSAPIWTVARSAWEAAGGDVAGTADPPENRKFGGEGTRTDRVTIGAARLGKGRVAIFGALLPQPSEEHDHWFGVNSYTVSVPGQTMLLRALRWGEGATPAPKPCTSRRRILVHLARGARRGRVTVAGRRAKVRRVSGRLVALVDLRGRRAGRVTVKVTSVMGSGKRVTQVRRFRTCARR